MSTRLWGLWVGLARPVIEIGPLGPAVGGALPLFLASALFGLRRSGWLPGDLLRFTLLGLGLIGLCLIVSLATERRGWSAHLAWRATALSLGLVAPALAIHVSLAQRALLDPVPVVLTPTVTTTALLIVALLGSVGALVVAQSPPGVLSAGLFPVLALSLWLSPLVARPDERSISAALAVTLGLAALVWLVSLLLGGWLSILAAPIGLLAIVGLTAREPGLLAEPTLDSSRLLLVHLLLPWLCGSVQLGLPLGLIIGQAWRRSSA